MTTTPGPRTPLTTDNVASRRHREVMPTSRGFSEWTCIPLQTAVEEAEARADVDGLRDHVAALQSELRDLLAERREARMEVEVASRADVDGLVARVAELETALDRVLTAQDSQGEIIFDILDADFG